jgi:riboflavin synthase
MFTGIVTDVGTVLSATGHGAGLRRIRIACAFPVEDIALGASIACSGPCLTVVATGREASGQGWFEVDTAAETLRLTSAADWQPGTRLNLERALKIGDELGGHIVTGHVDGIATLTAREDFAADPAAPWGATAKFTFRVPEALKAFIAVKGSVCVDGTSLTVNEVSGDTFSVLLIPHTLAVTTWGGRKAGDAINLEVDLMARYAARLLEARG